jgi:hypothetical protein
VLYLESWTCGTYCCAWTCLFTRACAAPVCVCLQAAPGRVCLQEPVLHLYSIHVLIFSAAPAAPLDMSVQCFQESLLHVYDKPMLLLRCPVNNIFFQIVSKQNCLFRLNLLLKMKSKRWQEGEGKNEDEGKKEEGRGERERETRQKKVKYRKDSEGMQVQEIRGKENERKRTLCVGERENLCWNFRTIYGG